MTTMWLAAAITLASPRFEPVTDEDIATEDYFLSGTELIVVVTGYPSQSAHPYTGPQGPGFFVTESHVQVNEALMGSVQSGYLRIWQYHEYAPPSVESGILFLERWNLETISGGRELSLAPADLVASDAARGLAMRSLHFRDDEVWNGMHTVCILPEGLLRRCVDGEVPSTPEQVVAHLRVALAGRPGLHLPGLDPAELPAPEPAP